MSGNNINLVTYDYDYLIKLKPVLKDLRDKISSDLAIDFKLDVEITGKNATKIWNYYTKKEFTDLCWEMVATTYTLRKLGIRGSHKKSG